MGAGEKGEKTGGDMATSILLSPWMGSVRKDKHASVDTVISTAYLDFTVSELSSSKLVFSSSRSDCRSL